VPFAGHPNIGTAIVIAREWLSQGKALPRDLIFQFEEKAWQATKERVEGECGWLAVQGEDMGRRSVLHGRTVLKNGCLISSHVGGGAVVIMRGEIS